VHPSACYSPSGNCATDDSTSGPTIASTDEILIACGDVDLLERIVADLPDDEYDPIATKTGRGIVDKLRRRSVRVAVVHRDLQDDYALELCREVRRLDPPPGVLFLAESTPDDGPFDRALEYPIPGPVFRNALSNVVPDEDDDLDLDRWKAFYREVERRLDQVADQDYYELLGVSDGAAHHEIVDAFDRLSMRYHPDRYQRFRDRKWGRALHEKAGELYTVLTEAFEVLGDRRLRKRYDELRREGKRRMPPDELSTQESGPTSLTEAAQSARAGRFLEMAQTEIADENWESAAQNLEFAQSIEPDNDRIAEKLAEIEEKLQSR